MGDKNNDFISLIVFLIFIAIVAVLSISNYQIYERFFGIEENTDFTENNILWIQENKTFNNKMTVCCDISGCIEPPIWLNCTDITTQKDDEDNDK